MNFCQFEKDPRIYLKQLQKKRSKKTSKKTSKPKTKKGVFKRTKLKATIKPKVSVDKYKQKLEGMIETCVHTRFTEFTKEIQKIMMDMKNSTTLSKGNTNAKIEKDVESLKNDIQKIISRLPDGNAVNKDIHYLQQNMEQVIKQIQNLQVDVSQLKQEVVPIVRETIDPWDDGHGNRLSSPRETTPEPANKDTTPELEEKAPEPANKDTTPEPEEKTATEPANKDTTPEPEEKTATEPEEETATEPANKDTTPELEEKTATEPEEETAPEPDNIPETTTNEIVEEEPVVEEPVVEEPVAKAN